MNDIEKILMEMLECLKEKDLADDKEIANQENSIKTSNAIILDRKKEKEERVANFAQFQALLNAVKAKAENDRDALAALYVSDKTHSDFEEFETLTGIGIPREPEASEEDAEEMESATA